MPEELRKLLTDTSAALGVEITEAQAEAFQIYKTLLQDWNTRINLTAITEDSEIMIKHFADSLSILPLLREKGGQTLVDVGTGAGFPGLPVAICCPEMSVTLVDSLEKRVRFLREVAEKLGLRNVKCVHARAEELGRTPEYRENFDFAVARAVASMPVLLEYCLPLVKVGGAFIAMKGANAEEEVFDKALSELGGTVRTKKKFCLPGTDIKRCLFFIEKNRQISTKYPRKAGLPAKQPL